MIKRNTNRMGNCYREMWVVARLAVRLPFKCIANVFQQVPAICHLSGLRCTFMCCSRIDTAAIAGNNLYFRIFSEPGSQRTLIAAGKQDQGTVSLKVDYQRAVTMAPVPCPFVDSYVWGTGLLCLRSAYYPAKKGIRAGRQACRRCSPLSRFSTGNPPQLIL